MIGLVKRALIVFFTSVMIAGCTTQSAPVSPQPLSPQLLSDRPVNLSFDQSTGSSHANPLNVISGRLLPVVNKEKNAITAWRVVGEIFNGGDAVVQNAQTVMDVSASKDNEKHRSIIPDPVQPGGFIPLSPNEREVYDVVILDPSGVGNASIGMTISDPGPGAPVRLDISNLGFVKKDLSNGSEYHVNGTIRNDTTSPVKDLIVRYWAVLELPEMPSGSKTKDEVVGVGTFRAQQDVLAPQEERDFDAIFEPLSASDAEHIASTSAELSALGMGTPIKL